MYSSEPLGLEEVFSDLVWSFTYVENSSDGGYLFTINPIDIWTSSYLSLNTNISLVSSNRHITLWRISQFDGIPPTSSCSLDDSFSSFGISCCWSCPLPSWSSDRFSSSPGAYYTGICLTPTVLSYEMSSASRNICAAIYHRLLFNGRNFITFRDIFIAEYV